MKRIIALVILACIVVAAIAMSAGADIFVGRRVKGSVPCSQIDHSRWNRLLQKHVDDDGMVNYRNWHASASDRKSLIEYLELLSTAALGLSRSEDAKLAFWINAYNAVTIHGILREYPTSTIRNHTSRLGGYNIWKHLKLYVDGQAWSLNEIEHEILRKTGDARIHFAIVCASVSCPRLLNQAYTAAAVKQQLDTNARDFFSRSQNFRFDRSSGRMQLSSILDWFGKDFGSSRKAQLQTIADWLPTKEAAQAARSGNVTVSYLDYDWNLNEQ